MKDQQLLKLPLFYPSSGLSRWLPPHGAAIPGWLAPAPRQPLPLQPFIPPPVPTATTSMCPSAHPTATTFTTAVTTETITRIGQDYSSRHSICRSVRLAMAQRSQKVVIFSIMPYGTHTVLVLGCSEICFKWYSTRIRAQSYSFIGSLIYIYEVQVPVL